MRYHVDSYYKGTDRIGNSTAFDSQELAEAAKVKMEQDDVRFEQIRQQDHLDRLRDSVLDLDDCGVDTDVYPLSAIMEYTYRVAPCANGNRCVACYEAGFIEM